MRPHVRRLTAVELYAASQVALLGAALAGAALTSRALDWHPIWVAAVLAVIAAGAEAVPIRVGHVRLASSFSALVLAMVFLGPAPATAIGLLATLVDGLRRRRWRTVVPWLEDIATYAVFPLAGGLLARALLGNGLHESLGLRPDAQEVALAVGAVYAATNLLNFALVALLYRVTDGRGLLYQARTMLVPLLPSEAAAAVLRL